MTGDPIPIQDHISRLIKASDVDTSGRVQGSAFLLKEHVDGVSTHWIEQLAQPTREAALRMILGLLGTRMRKIGPTRQLAVVNAGAAIGAVNTGGWPLMVVEDPIEPPPSLDAAHTLAVVQPIEVHKECDMLIAELIAQEVISVHPVADL